MILEYIDAALSKAKYERLDEGRDRYYGEVPVLRGVWATGRTLEECRSTLLEVIEGWLIVRLRKGLTIPPIGNRRISPPRATRVGT
ncbi:MAG: type II toxin-antitoxin system HicB family antitoxin [Phycisphaerales bacterium]|nr:type II toxin-antitoxin system HicB family antitoxin [Phycisphaerales bacterium]